MWGGHRLELDNSAKLFSLTFLLVTFGAVQTNGAGPILISSYPKHQHTDEQALLLLRRLACLHAIALPRRPSIHSVVIPVQLQTVSALPFVSVC